jgi:hypothetical protein
MYDIVVSLKKYLQKEKLWGKYVFGVNSVHDASYHLVHKDLMKDNFFPEVCRYFFTDYCSCVTGDKLGMEMVVGDRWKPKENVAFHGETAWNSKDKKWEWKK